MTPFSFRTAWQLVKPYWFGDDRWKGRGLLAAIVALSLGQVALSVRINQWNAVFYNALQDKKFDVFLHQLGIFSILAALYIAAAVYQQYFMRMLHIRWRRWMTVRYQARWLSNRNYYQLQSVYRNTDNPDQRIADDIDQFAGSSLTLTIGLLSSVVTLVSFVAILWGLSGPFTFQLAGHAITIPAYMVWAALLYAVIGTWITHLIGRKLVVLNVDQQRYEANFRYALIRLRENAEAVAFYGGEAVEERTLAARFRAILDNWWAIMRKQKQLNWFTSGYGQIAIIFPFVVAAPRYFSGAIQLGGLMQTASAFGQVQGALSWFIDSYSGFASWKATSLRLQGFLDAMQQAENTSAATGITRHEGAQIATDKLALNLPDGSKLLDVANLTLQTGARLLITGDSGRGKTTLLRALAGLWPSGAGSITLPAGKKLLFIPQRPYLPLLSLREIVTYPDAPENFSDAAIAEALQQVGLATLVPALDAAGPWAQSLSPGEQQKLAFARILLHKPDILLLDEVTASLDESAEAQLYETLLAALPDATIISTGHRAGLKRWHSSEQRL